jgi:hypothetical protein
MLRDPTPCRFLPTAYGRALAPAPERGKVWKPSKGFHHNDEIDTVLGYRGYDALITRDNLVMGGV